METTVSDQDSGNCDRDSDAPYGANLTISLFDMGGYKANERACQLVPTKNPFKFGRGTEGDNSTHIGLFDYPAGESFVLSFANLALRGCEGIPTWLPSGVKLSWLGKFPLCVQQNVTVVPLSGATSFLRPPFVNSEGELVTQINLLAASLGGNCVSIGPCLEIRAQPTGYLTG